MSNTTKINKNQHKNLKELNNQGKQKPQCIMFQGTRCFKFDCSVCLYQKYTKEYITSTGAVTGGKE